MGCKTCCVCSLVTRIVFLVVLLALVPSGYLTYEYYLKPWGTDRLQDFANAAITSAAASGVAPPDLSGTVVDGVACVQCPGLNNVYPVTSTSHPTYGGFQKAVINNGAWFTSMLMIAGVAIGGGGSLVITLLHIVQGSTTTTTTSTTMPKPTSSTLQNGCGIFEMVFMVSQAQFITMLGALQLEGAPLFFYEFAKKLAWTNLQIFPPEASFDPSLSAGSARRRLAIDSVNATGVERYALLIGAEPKHLFYYTCVAIAVAMGVILVVYLALRLVIGALKKRSIAATLDHRVIWVYMQLLLLLQYGVSMAACFQIYYTVTAANQSTGDLGLAIVMLALLCIGVLVFGIVKVARHRDEIQTHGTPAHDDTKPFHLRYAVLYQDFTVANVYFFAAKMVLDMASGAVVGSVQDGALQIAILVAFNVAFLIVLIWRQPFLVPLFYFVAVFAGYLRVVLLLLTLVQTQRDLFPQDVRDFVAVLVIVINAVLLMCILVRQFYVLSVAIFRYASRKPMHNADDEDAELGIPLQDMRETRSDGKPRSSRDPTSRTSTKTATGSSQRGSSKQPRSTTPSTTAATATASAPSPVIPDTTLFSSQPYHEMRDDTKARHSMPSAFTTSATSTTATKKGGGRRSLYSQRTRRKKEYTPATDDQLPDWAKV